MFGLVTTGDNFIELYVEHFIDLVARFAFCLPGVYGDNRGIVSIPYPAICSDSDYHVPMLLSGTLYRRT